MVATSRPNIIDISAETFANLLSGPLLDIHVGASGAHWLLHQNLLSHHSKFFDTDSLPNDHERHIHDARLDLPNEDPAAFGLLVKWLYQGRIDDVSALPHDQKWDYAFTCQKLYFVCQTVGLQDLQNEAIDQFRKGCYETGLVPGAEEIAPVYARTSPGSPLRKLVSRIAARQIMDPDSRRDAGIYHACFSGDPDFAVDVINAIRDGCDGVLLDDPTEGNSCRFHEHTNGESCHKTVKFDESVLKD